MERSANDMPEWNLAGPRYKYPVSSAELERRLSAVQAAMRDKGLDCCIAQTPSTIFDSITRYLTDSAANPYSTTLLIPAQGGLVLINHGVEMDPAPIPPTLRNVEKLIRKPYCQPFGCTDGMIGAVLSREIRSRGFRRIGVILRQLMSADTLEGVREGVPGCELVDFTAEFSRIKAVKSPEEWALIDRCLRAHEQLMAMVPALLRPGRMEYEVLADLEHASRYLCCDWLGNVAVGSAPGGGGGPARSHGPGAERGVRRLCHRPGDRKKRPLCRPRPGLRYDGSPRHLPPGGDGAGGGHVPGHPPGTDAGRTVRHLL